MEEIDIIELLQRVKEGKAPKEIEIFGEKYEFNTVENDIFYIYTQQLSNRQLLWLNTEDIKLNTKIKILDKPIIEKFEVTDTVPLSHQFRDKINEIIDYINQNNKE